METRYNEGPRDWQNLFAIAKFHTEQGPDTTGFSRTF